MELLHLVLGDVLDEPPLRLPAVEQALVELLTALPPLLALLQRPELQLVVLSSDVDCKCLKIGKFCK